MALRYKPDDDYDSISSEAPHRLRLRIDRRIIFGLVALVAVTVLFWIIGSTDSIEQVLQRPPEVVLTGNSAGRLEPGAAVRFGEAQIGEVIQCGVERGRPFARVRLDESWMDRLTTEHSFKVTSFNPLRTNNAAVIVESPPAGTAAGTPLERGSEIVLSEPAFPVEFTTPVCILVIAACFVMLWLVLKASKAVGRVLFISAVVGGAAFAVWLLLNGSAVLRPILE